MAISQAPVQIRHIPYATLAKLTAFAVVVIVLANGQTILDVTRPAFATIGAFVTNGVRGWFTTISGAPAEAVVVSLALIIAGAARMASNDRRSHEDAPLYDVR